jgi:hypothetical protein
MTDNKNVQREISQHPQTLVTFGIIQDSVVKKKFFEYGLDKRLS